MEIAEDKKLAARICMCLKQVFYKAVPVGIAHNACNIFCLHFLLDTHFHIFNGTFTQGQFIGYFFCGALLAKERNYLFLPGGK